jgi:quercetin 2,3-dioxygenase
MRCRLSPTADVPSEDWFPRGLFGKHPHRGIETVTYVVEGRIDHYDNQGHEGTILCP